MLVSNYSVDTNDGTGKEVEGSSTGSVEYKIPTYASEEGRGTQLYYMTDMRTTPTLK